MAGVKRGRPLGILWDLDYFNIQADNNIKCCIKKKNGDLCSKIFTSKTPHNLEEHLRTTHKSEFTHYQKIRAEKAEEKKRKPDNQVSVTHYIQPREAYVVDHPKQKSFEEKLAIFFGGTTVAYNIVENPLFKLLVNSLDNRITIPGYTKLRNSVETVEQKMRKNLLDDLATAKRIYIMADIWTKRWLTESFLGISASFFSHKSHQKRIVALAVRTFPHPHTGERILDLIKSVCDEWNIDKKRIHRAVTDNGSNICRAFSIVDDEELSDEEDMGAGERVVYNEMGLEEESDDLFEEIESELCGRFASFAKRTSCFAHTLDLVARKIDSDDQFGLLIDGLKVILKLVMRSSSAKQEIKELTGRNPKAICKTRWTYRYFWLKELFDQRVGLDAICDKHNLDRIQQSQWDRLKIFKDVLELFAELSGLLEGDRYTTMSSVIPGILGMQISLRKLLSAHSILDSIIPVLLNDIERRFNYILKPHHEKYDPIYALATLFDPEHCWVLSEDKIAASKRELKECLKNDDIIEDGTSTAPEPTSVALPSCRIKALEELFREKAMRRSADQRIKPNDWELELSRYLDFYQQNPTVHKDGPIGFWKEQCKLYPSLHDIAVDVLCCPASTATVERMFSVAGSACSGQRNRLSGRNLEREILIRENLLYV